MAVQIIGIPTVLLCAYLAKEISLEVFKRRKYSEIMGIIVFLLTLSYYPLSYWTLMGMETGLVTIFTLAGVIFSLRWLDGRVFNELRLSAVFLGLAFLTRNDAFIFALIVFGYLGSTLWKENGMKGIYVLISS